MLTVLFLFFGLFAGPRGAFALPARSVLVLSISDGGHAHEALRIQVGEFLKRAGAQLVEVTRIPAAQRSCEETRCLTKVAEEYRAELILAARIEHRSGHDRIIDMWLYDARNGSDQTEQEVCDARDISEKLRELAGRLIGTRLQDSAPAVALRPPHAVSETATGSPSADEEPTAAIAAAAASPALRRSARPPLELVHASAAPSRRWSPLRLGLAIGLGTLAVGALGTAIGLNTMQGTVADSKICFSTSGQPTACGFSLIAALGPSYAVGAALAISTVLTLTLPGAKEVRR